MPVKKNEKIYDDDTEVFAHTTKIAPDKTKAETDGVLAKFGIKDVWWRYDPANNDVVLKFILPKEKFGEIERDLSVQIEPSRIWHLDKHGETINWSVTMRNMFWYIQTHLSQAYVNRSGKFTEFLPHIITRDGRKVVDVLSQNYALPAKSTITPLPIEEKPPVDPNITCCGDCGKVLSEDDVRERPNPNGYNDIVCRDCFNKTSIKDENIIDGEFRVVEQN